MDDTQNSIVSNFDHMGLGMLMFGLCNSIGPSTAQYLLFNYEDDYRWDKFTLRLPISYDVTPRKKIMDDLSNDDN